MSAGYLSWAGASAENSDERANLLRPGVFAGRAPARLCDHPAPRTPVRRPVRLATGTLYPALDRLTAGGYVELVSEEIVNGRARRSYGLTPPGAGALRAEAERMAAAASMVMDRGQSRRLFAEHGR